jgi:hypothetical protein
VSARGKWSVTIQDRNVSELSHIGSNLRMERQGLFFRRQPRPHVEPSNPLSYTLNPQLIGDFGTVVANHEFKRGSALPRPPAEHLAGSKEHSFYWFPVRP